MAIKGSEPDDGVIVPCLVVPDVDEALRFYHKAFGAEELYRSPYPVGIGPLVNLRIWKSLLCLTQEEPGARAGRAAHPMTCIFQIRVPDADQAFQKAVRSGASPVMPPLDMFWGDRFGLVQDPFGHIWAITTVQEVLEPSEVAARLNAPVTEGE